MEETMPEAFGAQYGIYPTFDTPHSSLRKYHFKQNHEDFLLCPTNRRLSMISLWLTYSERPKRPNKKMIKCPDVLRWGSGNDLSSAPMRLKCTHINILNEIAH